MLGESKTKLTTYQIDPTYTGATAREAFDFGFQYMRHFSSQFNMSLMGTINNNYYIGLGFDF
jgi:hypothetical protein